VIPLRALVGIVIITCIIAFLGGVAVGIGKDPWCLLGIPFIVMGYIASSRVDR